MCRVGLIAHAACKFLRCSAADSVRRGTKWIHHSYPSAMCTCTLHMLVCPLALSCSHAASGLRPAYGLQDAPAACLASRPVDSAEGCGGRELSWEGWVRHIDLAVNCGSGSAGAVGLAGICIVSQHHLHCDGCLPGKKEKSKQCLHCTCNGLSGNGTQASTHNAMSDAAGMVYLWQDPLQCGTACRRWFRWDLLAASDCPSIICPGSEPAALSLPV